jgi:hypothetical protein
MHKPIVLAATLALLAGGTAAAQVRSNAPVLAQPGALKAFPYQGQQIHEVFGVIRAMQGTMLTVQTRRGLVTVDASWAIAHEQNSPLFVSRGVIMHGVFVKSTFLARDVYANNHRVGDWPPDS